MPEYRISTQQIILREYLVTAATEGEAREQWRQITTHEATQDFMDLETITSIEGTE